MFLHVIDDDPLGPDARVAFEHVHDQARTLELVLEVRCVDQDHLVGSRRQVHLRLQHFQFVLRVLVQTDLANAQHIGPVDKFWNQAHDFLG